MMMSTPVPSHGGHAGTFCRTALAAALVMVSLSTASLHVKAQTALADGPLFTTNNVPGNLGLLLSVEFPTAVSVAHINRTYANTSEYLGYFDPDKCYDYRYTDGTTTDNYFLPSAAAAANHICTGKWSGNFLNWASMQTIDPFRWVLTGGYRVIDTSTLTVVEKAWATGQGGTGNFPDSILPAAMLAGATPFPASAVALYMRIQGMGNKMRFTLPDTSAVYAFAAKFYNNTTRTGTAVLTRTDTAIDFDWGSGSPGTGVNTDNFSAQWVGTITAPTAGNYTFRIRGDDTVQLYVDNTLEVNQTAYVNNAYQNSRVINVAAGKVFNITLNMSEGGGGAGVQLQWMRPGDTDFVTIGPVASLYNNATHFDPSATRANGAVYEVFMRAKVCDPNALGTAAAGSLEANCTAYGTNYKPEGLIQKYANKIRYSAFGYLNDSNIQRDGGVLRARQKFVGPTQPVPGSAAVTNTAKEWDSGTGVFVQNPDATDATATNTLFGTAVQDSGVINYLNKFGQVTPGAYKTYDNVGELYYAAIRYFKNLGNVNEWTDMTGASTATKVTWADGFPVITDWKKTVGGVDTGDPILYSCQRNFVLGIGDVNTHADKNVPGNTATANEPAMPAQVTADTTVNAVTATTKVGDLEGLAANLGTVNPYNGCCSNNSALMAGLAYDSHTKDIRPDDPADLVRTFGKQTIDTYWVDVQEYQTYKPDNQFYLATKYGGFIVPVGYDPYTNATALTEAWWHTNTDVLGGQKRPDNYYSGSRPDLVKTGLETAFADIAAKIKAYTTSFSTSLPQVSSSGNKSYSSLYDASTWTGEITASTLSFDATTGAPSLVQAWTFSNLLAAQLAGTGWDTNRRVVTWNGSAGVAFRAAGTSKVTTTQLTALDPTYVSGNDSTNYLNYLRGDTTNEKGSTATGSTKAYRTRVKMLADIVGSKARPIGAPSFPFSDSTNPGYSTFKTTWASRPTVVYVGANDGMLHAIHGDLTSPPGGAEMFAYVPSVLIPGPSGTPSVDGLASLGNPAFTHHNFVNATPNVYDIDFGRTPDSSGAARTGTANWRSVLIGGLGKGGKSYYAIDVTDPVTMTSGGETAVAAKVLWEFTDTDLGFTYGDPIVVKTKKYGWVVIFPSGYNNTDGQGHFLIVNPSTGALLEKVATGAGTPTNPAGLAFANSFVVDSTDGTADAVYGGDLLGNLWRWDVTAASGTYPAPVKIASLTDSGGSGQPVTSRPVIEVHPTTKIRFVMVGTGRLLDTTDVSSTQGQSFYMIADGTNARFTATPPTGISFPYTRSVLVSNTNGSGGATTTPLYNPLTKVGWYEDLGSGAGSIGWRVTTDSTTLLGSVSFAATLPNGSVCSPSGDSRVYGRDYAKGFSTLLNSSGASLSYVGITGNVTDLRYLSVNGKGTLITGTDAGNLQKIDISPPSSLLLRRLNWRELQSAD